MSALRPWISAGIAAVLLAACGQRGPLSLPEPDSTPPAGAGEPAPDEDDDDER